MQEVHEVVATQQLLSRKEAAAFLGLSVQTLAGWAWAKRYDLPFIKLGRLVKYRKSDLEAFVARLTVAKEAA